MERRDRNTTVAAGEGLVRSVLQFVDLIEDQELGRMHANLVQDSAHGLDASIVVGRRRVHDVQEQRRIRQFFERCTERRHEVGRQVANESDRIRDDYLALAGEAEAARDGVQCGEHRVSDMHVGFGQRTQQRTLACVGVADDRQHWYVAASTS